MRCVIVGVFREQARSYICLHSKVETRSNVKEAIMTYAKACSSATPAPVNPEYGAVTNHTGMPLK